MPLGRLRIYRLHVDGRTLVLRQRHLRYRGSFWNCEHVKCVLLRRYAERNSFLDRRPGDAQQKLRNWMAGSAILGIFSFLGCVLMYRSLVAQNNVHGAAYFISDGNCLLVFRCCSGRPNAVCSCVE